jgi:hypothetical protein
LLDKRQGPRRLEMIEHTSSNNHHEIRDAIRALCAEFPDE